MLTVIKNFWAKVIVNNTITLAETHNEDLVAQFKELMYLEELEALFKDPVNKMYLLNTYTDSMTDLLSNLLNLKIRRQIVAVDMHSYMKDNVNNIKLLINRLIPLLEQNKISKLIEHDLYEFLTMIKLLREEFWNKVNLECSH